MISREWRVFGIGLGIFVAATFLYEMIGLFRSLSQAEGGMETGAVLSVIFMIVVTFGVIAVIGGGLWWTLRSAARRSPDQAPESPRTGDAESLSGNAPSGQSAARAEDR